MDGKKCFETAVAMTDKYCKRFCDMVAEDFQRGVVEREYFVDEWEDFELMGWASFCMAMNEAGQGEWLAKINALDEQVLMSQMERQLIAGIGQMDKETLDGAVKAIQGLVGRSKVLSEQTTAEEKVPEVIVKFIGAAGDPITGLAIKREETETTAEPAEGEEV